MICSNRILQSVELILFLNKLDILDAKLKDQIQFKEHVPEFKGVNETKAVAKRKSLSNRSWICPFVWEADGSSFFAAVRRR